MTVVRLAGRVPGVSTGPGPPRGDLEPFTAPAVHQPGRRVKHLVPQCPGLCSGQVAVQGQELEPGEEDLGGHRSGQPCLVDLVVVGGEPADTGVLPGADRVLHASMDSMTCVDIGGPATPPLRVLREIGDVQGVPPAILVLEQAELRTWVRPLTAGGGAAARP